MEQVVERTNTKKKKRIKTKDEETENIVQDQPGVSNQEENDKIKNCAELIDDVNKDAKNLSLETEIATIATEIATKITDGPEIPETVRRDVEQSQEFNKLLTKNKCLINEIETTQENLHKNHPIKMEKLKSLHIRPYTESQLSALYTNSELEMLDQFNEQFIEAELKGLAIKQHPLYELLMNYLHVRNKICGNTLELEQFRNEYNDLQTSLWTTETATTIGRGICQDGASVTTVHSYQKATFHRAVFQSIVRILGLIRKLTYENHVLYSYSAEDLRLQIELYIQTAITNCMIVSKLDVNSPVIVSLQNEPIYLKPYLTEIRICISVLFTFQRKLIRDKQFVKETRDWLQRLIAILLRLATYQDHLFILNHLLRCPAGVGEWASKFIQLPIDPNPSESPFSDYLINHYLSILTIILTPIKERDKFLEDINQTKDTTTDELFVVVDSDGEEDDEYGNALKENDLVAFLTQLPFEQLFRTILLIDIRNYEKHYDITKINEQHILRYLAFSTALLKIINRGLITYNQLRYNQFSKRLSRFIRHIVQYATDQWEQFRKYCRIDDGAMMERLQIEYDSFFLRAIYYLYTAQKLGAWQFLAVIPYNLIRLTTVRRIYYFLHESNIEANKLLDFNEHFDYNQKLWDESFRQQFEEKLSTLADDELYYLLNTFANMALSRDHNNDFEFIVSVTRDLLQVGFISANTRDICSKTSRTLLTHLTSKHPRLLTIIFNVIKTNINVVDTLSLYLYEELPLTIWQISDNDLSLISILLTNDITTIENKLARMILSRLNWDILPYNLHCDVALLILKISEHELGLLNWPWQAILRLKLHINDRAFSDLKHVLDPDNYDIIIKGIRQQQPLASFVALLMTTWGHLVPLICTHGLNQLVFLQQHQKHEAVLFVLYLLIPLFIDCQESLINNERFQEIILNLINADRGYISMAKNLISNQTTVLQQFGNMIETQMVNYNNYNLDSPRLLVRLWLNTFISIPTWNRDSGVMYMIDVVIRASFFHSDAVDIVRTTLNDIQQCHMTQEQSGTISTLFKWVSSSSSSNTLICGSLVNYPWFAYIALEIEFEEKEEKTGLWRELLLQLHNQKGKVNVDAALKKSCSILKLPTITSNSLCLYRWAQQAMDAPIDHPLLALFWQKFFILYLTRLPNPRTTTDVGCVGNKFFDGLVNFTFLKRIKKRLQDTLDYYENLLKDSEIDDVDDDDDDRNRKQFLKNYVDVFKAFSLWLEEPKLQERNLLLPSLPIIYRPNLLSFILQGQTSPWLEYVDYKTVKDAQLQCVKIWQTNNFRYKKNINKPLTNPGGTMESSDPIERMLRRLSVYETPKQPPEIRNYAPIVPVIDFTNKEAMFKSLDSCFQTLKQFAHNHTLKLSEHKALDCSYQEFVPQLYRSVLNKVTRKVPCTGRQDTVNCSGAAIVVMEVQEARVNDRIKHQIQTNRNAFESVLTKSLQTPALALCTSSVTIQQTIKILQSQLQCNPASAELGIELFYYILSIINEESNTYLPTKTLFATCIEKLGSTHICGVEIEMPRLLEKILKEPTFGGYLAPHFSPGNVGTRNLLFMYSKICQEIGGSFDVTFALLSKFDVDNWLNVKNPKIYERSEFIQIVIKALTMLGIEPPVEALMLHGLYRRHLLNVFEFQFPEHYGEILIQLLKASNNNVDNGLLSKTVWFDVINSLTKPIQINVKSSLREQLRHYAQSQYLLQHQELLDTANLLFRHFTQERLQYGLYGLYPKCRNYIDIYVVLFGMVGHGLIVSSLNTHQGVLGDKLCQIIWPSLINIFAPWIVPYSMQHLKDNMASWIQQLADDRSILLPWIPTDVHLAQKVIGVFFECIQFLIHTLPGCNNILNFIWQWYVTCFAHTSVKEYILGPINNTFLLFPWENFWPSLNDLECMLRVIDQYLPDCHLFLGHIFISISWTKWLLTIKESPIQMKSRIYQCYLNLLIKLSNEPNVRHKYLEKITTLLVDAEHLEWDILEASVFQNIMDWYVMSCDCNVIFKSDPVDLDYRVLHFLKTVSGYDKIIEKSTTNLLNRRLIFIKAHIKLMQVYTNKNKSLIPNNEQQIVAVITQQLQHLETTVRTEHEFHIILQELLTFNNIQNINQISVKCFEQWIGNKLGDSIVIKSLFKVLCVGINANKSIAPILEITIFTYFQNNVSENFDPNWQHIADNLTIIVEKQTELEQILLDHGYILGLYALLLQRINKNPDIANLLNLIIDWINQIKICEQTEPKFILLWYEFLNLSLKLCESDQCATGVVLYKFAKTLLQLSEDKGSSRWGKSLLSVIGINRQDAVSIQFRFLCRALAGYLLAQLPEMKGEQQTVRHQANAPYKVGQAGGNLECAKVLMSLDFGQSNGKLKVCEELALNRIQDAANSLHNAANFLNLLVKQFYSKPYLKNIV